MTRSDRIAYAVVGNRVYSLIALKEGQRILYFELAVWEKGEAILEENITRWGRIWRRDAIAQFEALTGQKVQGA
jgi:hypothetical protein